MRAVAVLLLIVPLALMALTIAGLLGPLLRHLFRLTGAAALALASLFFFPPGEAGWVPLIVFAAALLLFSAGSGKRRGSPRNRSAPDVVDAQAPSWSAHDLGPAWRDFRDLAGWRARSRLDAAAASCARYMALAHTDEEPMAGLPIKIAKHLPEQIAECVALARAALPDERRHLIADTLRTIEAVAARADERRRELAGRAQDRFRARQAHLSRPED